MVLGPRRLDGLEARRALVLRVVEDLVVLATPGVLVLVGVVVRRRVLGVAVVVRLAVGGRRPVVLNITVALGPRLAAGRDHGRALPERVGDGLLERDARLC